MKQILKTYRRPYPLLNARERLLVWERVRGMWKGKKPEPIKALHTIRKGWDRDLPSV